MNYFLIKYWVNMNRIQTITIGLVIILLLNGINTFSQTNRGAANIKILKTNGKTEEIKLYEASYALVIGNGNYTNGWDNLPGVASDVAAVKQVLEQQSFIVETAENLVSRDFSSRIQQFIDDYGYQPNNRLLIYYAGHGHTLKSAGDGRDLGYIIPVDAPLPEKDDIGFRRKAVTMDTIQAFARQIEAKHALFVFDSCFSGKLISRDKITIPPVIQESVTYPVRQFITAGAANQSVPDDSVFRKAFVRGLNGEADRNSDGYITGSELADYLKEKVTNSTDRKQTPQYGKIRDIDLDRGDFIFINLKEKASTFLSDPTPIIPSNQPANQSKTSEKMSENNSTKIYPPCSIKYLSYSTAVNISSNGEARRIQIVVDNEEINAAEIQAVSDSPNSIAVTFEKISRNSRQNSGNFLVRSVNSKSGDFTIVFSLPCGRKQLKVAVR